MLLVTTNILIVGASGARRESLVNRVQALGYAVTGHDANEVMEQIECPPTPAAMVVCVDDGVASLMARLRRSRAGATIPVTLYGSLTETMGDGADVVDLGADHVLPDPVTDDQLRIALQALAGPAVEGDVELLEPATANGAAEDSGWRALEPFTVPKLLWTLHTQTWTGDLVLRDQHEVRLRFRKGGIVDVVSEFPDDHLGEGLLRHGFIDREQYNQARANGIWAAAADSGSRFVEEGWLTESELDRAGSLHWRHVIASIVRWTKGEWLLDTSRALSRTRVEIEPTPEWLQTAFQTWCDIDQLSAWLGVQHVPQVNDNIEEASLDTVWLSGIDGTTSIAALIEAMPNEQEGLARVSQLATLWVIDAIVLADDAIEGATTPSELDRRRLVAKLRDVRERDYFVMLGVSRDVDASDVHRAFEALTTGWLRLETLAPEVRSTMGAEIEEVVSGLQEARDVLTDDELRALYRVHLEEGG